MAHVTLIWNLRAYRRGQPCCTYGILATMSDAICTIWVCLLTNTMLAMLPASCGILGEAMAAEMALPTTIAALAAHDATFRATIIVFRAKLQALMAITTSTTTKLFQLTHATHVTHFTTRTTRTPRTPRTPRTTSTVTSMTTMLFHLKITHALL